MQNYPSQVRQGDVFLRPAQADRRGTPITDQGRVILAYGEITGHAHEIVCDDTDMAVALAPAQLFEQPDGKRFLFVDRPCALVHEEHGHIALAPGCYEVLRQREYSPEAIRNVAD